MMKSLILGCGDLGQTLAYDLVQHGHQVVAIGRKARQFAEFDYISQDLNDLPNISERLNQQQFDYIFCIVSPSERSVQGYQNTYLNIAQSIFLALQQQNPKKVFFISSTRVYAQDQGAIIDDDSPLNYKISNNQNDEIDPFTQILLASELVWSAYWQEKLCILRPTGLYQQGSQRLQKLAEHTTHIDSIHWSNRIHRADVVGFMRYLTQIDAEKIQSSYILSDSVPMPLGEILNYFRQKQGLNPLTMHPDLPHTGKKVYAKRLQQSGYILKYADFFKAQI
ncbi:MULTISPECIES: NAD-dependent epimerase/dehydratase family protein [unclassified Acinetobacter]|uniref:NAD-dependent epimerase/dehydratase family protein n=1 Tax=unclassified Acinetobacter TaxID=196816 RepID=UPI0035BACCD2